LWNKRSSASARRARRRSTRGPLAESNADILKRYPPRVVGMRVRGQRQKAARAWAFGGSLVVVAAALTLVRAPHPISLDRPHIDDGTRGIRDKGSMPRSTSSA
jgi:hypothetical protein